MNQPQPEKANTATFEEHHSGNPVLKIVIDGEGYGFSVRYFPEERRDWLAETLLRQMEQIHNRALSKGKRQVQSAIKGALNLV